MVPATFPDGSWHHAPDHPRIVTTCGPLERLNKEKELFALIVNTSYWSHTYYPGQRYFFEKACRSDEIQQYVNLVVLQTGTHVAEGHGEGIMLHTQDLRL